MVEDGVLVLYRGFGARASKMQHSSVYEEGGGRGKGKKRRGKNVEKTWKNYGPIVQHKRTMDPFLFDKNWAGKKSGLARRKENT